MLRILLTGGGTGGHIYPIVAVTDELRNIAQEKNIAIELLYLGAPGDFARILTDNGIAVSKILDSKWRRYFDLRNITDIPKFFLSCFQAVWKIFWIMPDVLFSKGGPGSLPVILACRFYRIPVFIHESDTIPGLSNRLGSRFASWIGLAFESAKDAFKVKAVVEVVGNPIRRSLLSKLDNPAALKRALGFNENLPLLLILGSSQGASRINDFILDSLPLLLGDTQLLHQTGANNFNQVSQESQSILKTLSSDLQQRYHPTPYFDKNYSDVLQAADIIVSRASATIFEIAAFGKPSILIPLPESAGDHQRVNACAYAKSGAAIVIEGDNLKPNIFITQLRQLLTTPGKLQAMSAAALEFAKPDAARKIAETILTHG